MTNGPVHPKQLSETLAAITALNLVAQQFSPQRLVLPQEAPTARMLRLLGAAQISPAPPSDFLEDVRRNLVTATRLGEFSPRDLRYAPWLLWNGDPPVANLPNLLPKLLEQASRPGRTLQRLIEAYLRDFDPAAPGIDEAAAAIRQELSNGGPRLDTWRTAQKEVLLFDPARGPEALANQLLEPGQQPDELLARYKLTDPLLATGKYMLAVEDAVRNRVPQLLCKSGISGLVRILQIVAQDNVLRFRSRIADTARALLRTWLDEDPEPNAELRGQVQRCLLQWLEDPRLPSGLQRWAAVGERETALVRRWLTRASLDLFFRLIDQHARDTQWHYRQAFWLAYLNKGAIADAWLALGSQIYGSALAIHELGGAYGQLRGDSKQCALLLRIGSVVICEFTHVGKLLAWPSDWRNAPRLGQAQYTPAGLKQNCLRFPADPWTGHGGSKDGSGLRHDGAFAGKWQRSAAALIENQTGLRITQSDWQPK
jgi:hypothetical protein